MTALSMPLLMLAIVQAIWIAASGSARHPNAWRYPWRWFTAIRHPSRLAGVHTVPLGLAIVTGLLTHPSVAHSFPQARWLPWAGLVLTWITVLACLGHFAVALSVCRWTTTDVDGTWFLVPAAALGAAVATADTASLASGEWPVVMRWLALAAAVSGWFGYWAVTALAARKLRLTGLGPTPRAPWWIAMGCAGLAAAALGNMVQATAWPPALGTALTVALMVTAIAAIVLMIPVTVLSIHFLLRKCRFRNHAAWPPTFSTAVFALGCLAAGTVWHSAGLLWLGVCGGFATLGLWAATMLWNVLRTLDTKNRRHPQA